MDSFTRLDRPDALSYRGVEAEVFDVLSAGDLELPVHRAVYRWWDAARGARAMPAARDFDIAAVSAAAGWLHLLDVLDDGVDFRYRVYGTEVANATGLDLNGRLVSAQPEPIRGPILAIYRDVVRRPRVVRSLLRFAGPGVASPDWDRIVLPLGEDGSVSRIVAVSRLVTRPRD